MEPKTQSDTRRKVNAYTAALILALVSFFFLTTVPFLPGTPVFPLLVAIGLGLSSLRRPTGASLVLYALVSLSIVWQLIGFGLAEFFKTPLGNIVAAILIIALLANTLSARLEPTSMALAVFAVALMLTPQYYLSAALIAAAAAIYGLSSIGPISSTFIVAMLPMLFLENAILFASLPKGVVAAPVIFSQLTGLASNLRPPLPGLNIFLTGLPPNFISSYSLAVTQFISNRASFLIVPIFLLGIVFSSSASIAAIVNSALNRLSVIPGTSRILRILSPLVASIMTSMAFTALIVALSSRGIGGYETSLNTNPSHAVYMILSSTLLGAVFTAREFFIQRLESSETARDRLLKLLAAARIDVKRAHEVVDRIIKDAPTVDLAEESKALDEHSSYVADIERGAELASYTSLMSWVRDLEQRLLPFLEGFSERLRVKTINELNTMSSLVSTFNASIRESGVETGFPELADIRPEMGIDNALKTYGEAMQSMKEAATRLFGAYVSATSSFNTLWDREAIAPPVNPTYLFDSYDYMTGLKLLGEEYWLNFYASYDQEFENRIRSLSSSLTQLEEICDAESWTKIEDNLKSIEKTKPSDSVYVLQKIMGLVSLFDSLISETLNESEQLEKMIAPFLYDQNIIIFESIGQTSKFQNLRNELKVMKPSFENLINFVQSITLVLGDQAERKSKDENNLIMLSQYFVSKKVIDDLIQDTIMLKVSDLPFQHEAAIIFARLYSVRNTFVRYDDLNEALIRNA